MRAGGHRRRVVYGDALDRLIAGAAGCQPRRRDLATWVAVAVLLAAVLVSTWRLVI